MKKLSVLIFLIFLVCSISVSAADTTLDVERKVTEVEGEIILSGNLGSTGSNRFVTVYLMNESAEEFNPAGWSIEDYVLIEYAPVNYDGSWECVINHGGLSNSYLLFANFDELRYSDSLIVLSEADKNGFFIAIGKEELTKKQITEQIGKYYLVLGLEEKHIQDDVLSLFADRLISEHVRMNDAADITERTGVFAEIAKESLKIKDALDAIADAEIDSLVYDAIYNNKELFGIDFSDYNDLRSAEKKSVLSALKGEVYTKAEDLKGDFDALVEEAGNETENNRGGSSSSSSGGSFSASGPAEMITPPVIQPDSAFPSVFSDIDSHGWAEKAIAYLYDNNIVSGNGNGLFRPADNITREEFVKMLVIAFNMESDSAVCNFTDVDKDNWSYSYIAAATTNGIVNGISDSEFGFGLPITRQDMAVMIYRTLGANAGDVTADFKDFAEIAPYAKDAVSYLGTEGIINGTGSGNFEPAKSATRAECAKLIYEIIKRR